MQMPAAEVEISGNPGIVLRRLAPALLSWLGGEGRVLGGGTVLAARWQHRVSTDIDLFTDHELYRERIGNRRDEVAHRLGTLVSQAGCGTV